MAPCRKKLLRDKGKWFALDEGIAALGGSRSSPLWASSERILSVPSMILLNLSSRVFWQSCRHWETQAGTRSPFCFLGVRKGRPHGDHEALLASSPSVERLTQSGDCHVQSAEQAAETEEHVCCTELCVGFLVRTLETCELRGPCAYPGPPAAGTGGGPG